MDNNRALSILPKLWIAVYCSGRGAFYVRRRCAVRHVGAHRKANVGISNDKRGEKPLHRKTKVSYSMLIRIGLVGT